MNDELKPYQSEQEMKESVVPVLKTIQELTEYIESIVNRSHDYGTCVYAMSMAATAAFNYVAKTLEVTVAQADFAGMNFLTRSRGLKGPWTILTAEEALYPQYDLPKQLKISMEKWKPWLKEESKKKLEAYNGHVHPRVVAHWKRLSGEILDE